MDIVIADSIRSADFHKGKITDDDRQTLLRASKIELTTPIKGDALPKGTRLLKAYATSPTGAKRIAFMLSCQTGDLFLLFFRPKDDKLGKNMTISNPDFKKALHKRLDALKKDLIKDKYITL